MGLPVRCNLSSYRGDTFSQQFRLISSGSPVNLTGATIKSQARAADNTVTALTAALDDAPNGMIHVAVPATLAAGVYDYDVEVTKSGVITTWVGGTLTVTQDVTT